MSAQSRVSAAGGFTSTAHTAGPAFSPARCGRSTTGWSRRTRPSSTRTSGCSRRSTAALLYRDPQLARATHTQDASYLDVIHTSEGEWNPSDYAYQLTRRARGLPLWFSLSVHGSDAYRDAVERVLATARATAERVRAHPHLELVREPELSIVLFKRTGWTGPDYDAWSARLLDEQIAFVTPSRWHGEPVARLAFLHPETTLDIVDEVLDSTR